MRPANSVPEEPHLWLMCKALGNPVRLQIIRFVQRHPNCISNQIQLQLPDDCCRAQSTLSQHLKVLREAGLLLVEDDGQATAYTVNDERLSWMHSRLGDLLA